MFSVRLQCYAYGQCHGRTMTMHATVAMDRDDDNDNDEVTCVASAPAIRQ